MSKLHPGQSEAYKRKCEIRKSNEIRRNTLKEAKDLIKKRANVADSTEYRQQATKISKLLRAQLEEVDTSKKDLYNVMIDQTIREIRKQAIRSVLLLGTQKK